MVQFRKSKTFGGVRLTASKRGLGVSVGKGPLRVSRGADGKVRRTIRAPGTGIFDTKVIGGKKKNVPAPAQSARPHPVAGAPRPDGTGPVPVARTQQVPKFPPATWARLIEKDGTARALTTQRWFVEASLRKQEAGQVRLTGLTIGQAERIMRHLNEDPAKLHQQGRGSRLVNQILVVLCWLLVVILTGLCLVIPVVGPFIAAGICALVGYKLVERKRELAALAQGGQIPAPTRSAPVSSG